MAYSIAWLLLAKILSSIFFLIHAKNSLSMVIDVLTRANLYSLSAFYNTGKPSYIPYAEKYCQMKQYKYIKYIKYIFLYGFVCNICSNIKLTESSMKSLIKESQQQQKNASPIAYLMDLSGITLTLQTSSACKTDFSSS